MAVEGGSQQATSSLHGCCVDMLRDSSAPQAAPFIHGAINSNYRINNSTDSISGGDICRPILTTYAAFH